MRRRNVGSLELKGGTRVLQTLCSSDVVVKDQSMGYGDPNAPLSVSELTQHIQQQLNQQFQSVWVSGEISNLAKPRSGHLYMALKDEGAVLQAAIWRSVASRLQFDLEDGLEVICRGDIDVYPPRGSYQLIVRDVVPKGLGSLQLAFKQLFERLQREGLFEEQHKQTLPRIPRKIAFVTSPTGAAVRDFLEVLRRRWRDIHVLVVPAKVQGRGAAEEIAAGIRKVNALREKDRPEVLVVGRGGGSLEDLWCFNEEIVVRAIHASKIPTISAVGHEIDVSLSDLAADVRALTPSEAAERIVPNRLEVQQQLIQTKARFQDRLRSVAAQARGRLEALASRQCLESPLESIRKRAQQVDQLDHRLVSSIKHCFSMEQRGFQSLGKRLEAVSPLGTLQRGYSITTLQGQTQPLNQAQDIKSGATLVTQLTQGQIVSQVTEVQPLTGASTTDTSPAPGNRKDLD